MTYRRIIGLLFFGLLFLSDMMRAQDLPSACGNGKVRYRMRGQPGSSFLWHVDGGEQVAYYASGDSIDVLWNNLPVKHSLSCQEYPATSCPGPLVSTNIDVISTTSGLITRTLLCDGQNIELKADNGFSRYRWQDGSSGATLKATSPGIYWVDISKGKCTVRDSMEVVFVPTPVVKLGRDTFICSPDQLLLDAGNPGMTYEWSNGGRTQTIWANEGDGLIWVKVTNDNNCSAIDSIRVKPCSPLNYLFIPNVFTPNGDGVNEVWRIGGLQYFPGTVVKLFDRWGRQIFVSEPGYPKPWDGKREGKLLPMDAYFYVIDLKDGSAPIRGSVTLVP